MKPRTFNLICQLSDEFKDPPKIKRLIKSYVDSNITHLKATNVRNTIEIFVKNGVSFNDVHNSARSLSAKIRNPKARVKAQHKCEARIMFMKLLDARRFQQSSERKMKSDKSKLAQVVRKGTPVWDVLMKQVKLETEELWKYETGKSKVKFQRCKEKQVAKKSNNDSIVEGVAVSESELKKYVKVKENETKVETYGGVTISENEKKLLEFSPDHMVYPRIVLDQIENDLEKCFIKEDWDEKRKGIEKEKEARKTENGDEVENEKDLKSMKIIDFAHKPSTSWKNNKRIIIPEIDDPEKEIRNNFVKKELLVVAENYIKENCNEKGNLKSGNLSKSQVKALKSLKSKSKEGVVILETDKTSKFAVDKVENVESKMSTHIQGDKVMDPAAVTRVENNLNSHTSKLIKIFHMGEL